MPRTLLTTEDVAARYRTTAATVRYWRHTGYGPAGVRVGRRVLYDEVEVEAFYDRLRTGAGSAA